MGTLNSAVPSTHSCLLTWLCLPAAPPCVAGSPLLPPGLSAELGGAGFRAVSGSGASEVETVFMVLENFGKICVGSYSYTKTFICVLKCIIAITLKVD